MSPPVYHFLSVVESKSTWARDNSKLSKRHHYTVVVVVSSYHISTPSPMSYAQSMRVINSSGLKRNASPTITANDEEMMDLVPNDPNFFQGTAVKSSGESSLMSRIIQGATVLTAFAVVVGWGTMQGGYLYQPNNASPTTSSQTPGETTNSFMVRGHPVHHIRY